MKCVGMFGTVPVCVVFVLVGQFSIKLEIGVVWLSVMFNQKHELIL